MSKYLVKINFSNLDAKRLWDDAQYNRYYLDHITGPNNEGIEVESTSEQAAIQILCRNPRMFAPNYGHVYPLRTDIWVAELVAPVNLAASIQKVNGMFCNCCKEFYPMAEANMPDGKMKCYSCRKYRSYQ